MRGIIASPVERRVMLQTIDKSTALAYSEDITAMAIRLVKHPTRGTVSNLSHWVPTYARLDRLAVLRSGAEGSGALGRHQRRSIVSGTDLQHNAFVTGIAPAQEEK